MSLDPILKLRDVLKATGLCRSALYEMMQAGSFPAAIERGAPGTRAAGWLESEVAAWIRSRPRKGEKAA